MLGSLGLYSTLTRKLGGCNVRSGSVGSSTRVGKKIKMDDILKCSFEINNIDNQGSDTWITRAKQHLPTLKMYDSFVASGCVA